MRLVDGVESGVFGGRSDSEEYHFSPQSFATNWLNRASDSRVALFFSRVRHQTCIGFRRFDRLCVELQKWQPSTGN